MIRQGRNIFTPVPQGGDMQGDDAEAIIKVFAESSFCNFFMQVLVGGGNDTYINLLSSV
jgi:hypothetical protein